MNIDSIITAFVEYVETNWILLSVIGACVIVIMILGIVLGHYKKVAAKRLRSINQKINDNTRLESECMSAKISEAETTDKLNSLKKEDEDKIARLNEKLAEQKEIINEFKTVFKESLMISSKTATIAVDRSNVLDALEISDLKDYAKEIDAKLSSSDSKDVIIKKIRAREVNLKSLDNARKKNSELRNQKFF